MLASIPVGSANTQQGVQKERPSLYTLVEEMGRINVPTLVVTGDEDWRACCRAF